MQALSLAVNRYVAERVPRILPERARKRRYPTRLLRYFITVNYLLEQRRRLGRPLRVMEVGVGRGQMLDYLQAALEFSGINYRDVIGQWIGVDVSVRKCRRWRYDRAIRTNIEKETPSEPFDVCILLHVIEHLFNPEAAVQALAESASPDSSFIIGVPCHPDFVVRFREKGLRAHTNGNGHVSAISRGRIHRLMKAAGLSVVDERNAFVLRATGSPLEDSSWWLAVNAAVGRAIPGYPGEYYCHAVRRAT